MSRLAGARGESKPGGPSEQSGRGRLAASMGAKPVSTGNHCLNMVIDEAWGSLSCVEHASAGAGALKKAKNSLKRGRNDGQV